jgi:hypothetical protein
MILSDINVNGERRKVLMQLNRNAFLYVIDRTNGVLISAKQYEKANWASAIDQKTGRPIETVLGVKVRAGEEIEMWPSTRGGKNWPHASFNPETGLLYAPTMHRGGLYKHLPVKDHVVGQRFQFIENRPTPSAIGGVIDKCYSTSQTRTTWLLAGPPARILSSLLPIASLNLRRRFNRQ